MKILILSNKNPYPPIDGGSIATFNLALGFSESNCDVTLLVMNTSKHYFSIKDIPKHITEKLKFNAVFINTGINLANAAANLIFSRLPYNAVRFISKDFENELINLLRSNKYDIIQLEGLYLVPYIETIRNYSSAKIAMRTHNVEHEIWERKVIQESKPLKKVYLKILANRIKKMEIRMINSYDLLVPITQRDESSLKQLGNEKPSCIIPTGYDLTKLKNIDNQQEYDYPSLFHLGALDWAPNQDGILWFLNNCWDIILSKQPELKLYIAGRNAPDWFINKIKRKNIIYCGEVDDAQQFMKSKSIMVVPLFSGSGMRVKIIEGMALGKTIVTTTIGTEGIDTEHGKNILIADTAGDFTEIILKAISDKELISQIGEKAYGFVLENFNNLAISKKLLEFYRKFT